MNNSKIHADSHRVPPVKLGENTGQRLGVNIGALCSTVTNRICPGVRSQRTGTARQANRATVTVLCPRNKSGSGGGDGTGEASQAGPWR